jgi:hypothetical protein
MKTSISAFGLGLCCMALAWSGCVGTLDGKHQAGVPFVRDTIEGRYERPLDQVMKAARDTIKYNGVLTVDNVVNNTLEGRVDKRTVWMAAEAVTPSVTRISIQVRGSGGGTDIELASHLREQIAVRLATGNLMPATAPTAAPKPAGTR